MPNTSVKTRSLIELEKRFQVQLELLPKFRGLILLGVLVLGCAPSALEDGERRLALRETTERVILPTYAELNTRAAELASLLEELEMSPADADLSATRQAYLDVRAPWEESQAFGFGPAADLHAQAGIDQSPIDTSKLEAELASESTLSDKYVRNLGANKRGLHAIEYLLFPADDAELEAALLRDDVAGGRRRRFVSAAGRVVADNAGALLAAWDPEQGDYAGRFSKPGGPESVAADVQSGLDTLLNETVVVSEVVANVKLGEPLGASSGGKIDPAAQESERSGATRGDLLANLRGMRNVYFASREQASQVSLSSLVHGRSPATDRHARAAFADADAALRAMPEPFTRALEESPESVQAAYDAVKALKRVLATEVLGSLGASLKFSDNDGD